MEQFRPKIEIGFDFMKEIPLKMNRTKKKIDKKIELTLNVEREIPLKLFGTKNNHP